MSVEEAKKVLKDNGYFTDNLWTVGDVQHKFKCTEEQAQYILEKALTNDATMEQIWLSIDIFGEMENLEKVDSDS